jgi:ppGpp synthetase/RelA/SpoT-type nucleotidyltranferase
MFSFERPKWKKVEYSRSKIIKAGKIIKKEGSTSEHINATQVIDNWRAAHAYPLHVIYIHLRKMASNRTDIVVAERLKRLDSIINKLKREPSMSLWTIQDLGGCRFIVPTVNEVFLYADKYKNSRIRHRFVGSYDYISTPCLWQNRNTANGKLKIQQ